MDWHADLPYRPIGDVWEQHLLHNLINPRHVAASGQHAADNARREKGSRNKLGVAAQHHSEGRLRRRDVVQHLLQLPEKVGDATDNSEKSSSRSRGRCGGLAEFRAPGAEAPVFFSRRRSAGAAVRAAGEGRMPANCTARPRVGNRVWRRGRRHATLYPRRRIRTHANTLTSEPPALRERDEVPDTPSHLERARRRPHHLNRPPRVPERQQAGVGEVSQLAHQLRARVHDPHELVE
mmetsp:Transcript_123751/g.396037  ORF Transcript_123751/g.396037 Transcript_123751/m.396037 type:complete len:236 (-) Transcript_123751:2977-3684(-)